MFYLALYITGWSLFGWVKCLVCFIDSTNHYQLTITHALALYALADSHSSKTIQKK
jgi:hypothetical protein